MEAIQFDLFDQAIGFNLRDRGFSDWLKDRVGDTIGSNPVAVERVQDWPSDPDKLRALCKTIRYLASGKLLTPRDAESAARLAEYRRRKYAKLWPIYQAGGNPGVGPWG